MSSECLGLNSYSISEIRNGDVVEYQICDSAGPLLPSEIFKSPADACSRALELESKLIASQKQPTKSRRPKP